MACDAQTLAALSAANGDAALSERDRLMCLAAVYGTAAGLTGEQALALAAANGYHALSDDDLEKAFLAAIC